MHRIIEDNNKDEVESLFDFGDTSGAFKEFKAMLECSCIEDIGGHALKIIHLLHPGKIEEASVQMVGKYMSLLSRWYVLKEGKCPKKCDEAPAEDVFYIERYRVVVVKCKRGEQEKNENYRVISIFSKHSNTVSGSLIWRTTKLHLWKDQISTRLLYL